MQSHYMDEEELKQLVARVAKEELGEDENTRKQSLELFRDWIHKNSDIRDCRTDDTYLLSFLRHRKFSVPQAEETMIYSLRVMQNMKNILGDLDFTHSAVEAAISSGTSCITPYRDKNGCQVVVFFPQNIDYKIHDWKSVVKASAYSIGCLLEDDVTQVTGLTHVLDMSNFGPGLFTFFPLSFLYAICPDIDKFYPMRLKHIYCVNSSVVGNWFLNHLKAILPIKLAGRIKIFNSFAELHKELDPQVLPKEMGGTMPLADMVELWKKKLKVHCDIITLTTRTQLLGKSYKVPEYVVDTSGVAGSFKKLDID